jgi:UBX domain-containing protein 1
LNFFTGGERSGLNVQNPNHRRGDKAPEVVQNILKRAAEAGQRESERGGNPARPAQGSSSQSASSFAGRGRTINDEAAAAATTTPEAAPAPPTLTSEGLRALRNAPFGGRGFGGMMGEEEDGDDDEEDEIAIRRITLWQDGFSIEDGPLCRYDDPQHADTLALINSNRAPLHLLNVKFGQRVELHVEKKTQEKYTPPPPRPMKAFEGSGNRLGAPVATMTGAGSSATDSTAVPAAPAVPPQSTSFEVDASQPTTQIQIRLGNGQRMVAKFNHTHTVADIRRYINASDPAMGQRDYTLQSSFPPKPLSDETQSLKDANLINSVVIQKWS